MDDDSALDTTLGDHTASNMTMFPKADDSLLSSVLLRKEPANAPQEGPAPAAPGESESPERIRLQLEQLHQLNHMFESYERALRSSLTQTEVRTAALIQAFAQRISETDALLDSYTKIMLQGQRRRQLLNDESWRGATQVRSITDMPSKLRQNRHNGRTTARSDRNEQKRNLTCARRQNYRRLSPHVQLKGRVHRVGLGRPRVQAAPLRQAPLVKGKSVPVASSHPADAPVANLRYQYAADASRHKAS